MFRVHGRQGHVPGCTKAFQQNRDENTYAAREKSGGMRCTKKQIKAG